MRNDHTFTRRAIVRIRQNLFVVYLSRRDTKRHALKFNEHFRHLRGDVVDRGIFDNVTGDICAILFTQLLLFPIIFRIAILRIRLGLNVAGLLNNFFRPTFVLEVAARDLFIGVERDKYCAFSLNDVCFVTQQREMKYPIFLCITNKIPDHVSSDNNWVKFSDEIYQV